AEYAQVVLAHDDETRITSRQRRLRIDRLYFLAAEVRALRIEGVRQPAHRAIHDLVHVGRLDVRSRDSLHDVIQDAGVWKCALRGWGGRAQHAAHRNEQHEWCGNEEEQPARSRRHETILRTFRGALLRYGMRVLAVDFGQRRLGL